MHYELKGSESGGGSVLGFQPRSSQPEQDPLNSRIPALPGPRGLFLPRLLELRAGAGPPSQPLEFSLEG